MARIVSVLLWLATVLMLGCTAIISGPSRDDASPSSTAGSAGGAGGAGGVAAAGQGASAGSQLPPDDAPVDFFLDIQPILTEQCVRCHGGVRELGKPALNLQSREKAAFVLGSAGSAESSLLYAMVVLEDPMVRMPLGQPALLPDQVNKLRRWIFQGAPWPTHWAFAPNADPDPNAVIVSSSAWPKNAIDRFVLAQLEAKALTPSPEASKETLIRRVSLDLVGLLPTLEEIDAFLADSSATAYESVVDRLLASQAFGERWGRHWLDQARYADSAGYESDEERYNAYLWRDWVIDSFNRDQPFDQFTIEQIAGDLLPGATPEQRLATGFHVNTLVNQETGADPEEDRVKRIKDRTATVGQVWLGLTLGCAQCHSHPYDRIEQTEFYELYAFFDNADDGMQAGGGGQVIEATKPPVLTERQSDRRQTFLLTRGSFLTPDKSQELFGGAPGALHPFSARGSKPDRLDLAHWLVAPENSLTPRVIVNTIWSHLFGAGLVTSLDDFGARARVPSNPLLLEWLAAELGRLGWSRKKLIRTIVLSATYRQASLVRADAAGIDPDNVLLHRQNRLRADAEIVRDIFLSASGLLDKTVGGPCVYPPLAPEAQSFAYLPFPWPTSEGGDRYRRGLYTFHKRSSLHPNLEVFDRPKAQATDNLRTRSNTPLQALTTLHDQNFVEPAQALARRVQAEVQGDLGARITRAFRLVLGRNPTSAELGALQALAQKNRATYVANTAAAERAAGEPLPDSATLPDAAALANVSRIILNLDEAITRE
jgi:hypothetical protein